MLQKQVDAEVLERDFAGQPVLAYFEMCFREEVDAGKVVADAVSLAGAGYRMDVEELGEKTGYVLEEEKEEVGSRKDEGDGSLEGRLRAVAEADDEGDLERAVAVLNREFPAVGAMLGNGTYGTDRTDGTGTGGTPVPPGQRLNTRRVMATPPEPQ